MKRFILGPVTCASVSQQQHRDIINIVQAAVKKLGFPTISGEQCTKLVGIGTDGVAGNIVGAGLKGLVEKEMHGYLDVVHCSEVGTGKKMFPRHHLIWLMRCCLDFIY